MKNNPVLVEKKYSLPKSIAVIGAGTIGPDIAYYLKSEIPGLKLVLIDINQDALDNAVTRIKKYAKKGLDKGKLSKTQSEDVKRNLIVSTDYDEIADCDWVLEAATEDLELKRKIFSQVESLVRADAIITSNSSSLPASKLFSHLEHPQRCTITHFFAPAFRNVVVELADWEKTERDVIMFLRWFFCVTGKLPMLTKDVLCFMLDRVFDNWCNEAALLLDIATPAQVDTVASDYVHAGPFFVLNFANGNPIIRETNQLQSREEGEHYAPAKIFETAGKWETIKPGEKVDVDDVVASDIKDRLLGILFSQSVDILDREIGLSADLDSGCRLALGFKMGPLELMRDLGDQEVERILKKFSVTKPGMPMPGRALNSYQNFKRYILVDNFEGVKIITLRRPEALNALHDEMTDEILNTIKQYEEDDAVKGFVITGYGTRAFSAGADIGKFPSMLGDRQQSIEYARSCSRLLVHIDQCKKPVVAALNGIALGGGLELAIRCHSLVAVDDVWMQFPEITLGIVPGIGAMIVPYRRWPQAASVFHNMLFGAEKLSAQSAADIGMLNTKVDKHEELIPAAVQQVNALAGTSHTLMTQPVKIADIELTENVELAGVTLSKEVQEIMFKSIVDAAQASSFEEALEIGYSGFGDSACTAAAKEGISSFAEGRKPDFTKTG